MRNIDQKYGIVVPSLVPVSDIPKNTTKIEDLIPDTISFTDDSKRVHECSISIIKGSGRYKCFWDKCEIPSDCVPIACPIKYIPNTLTKKFHSEITKSEYVLTEPVIKNITVKDKTLTVKENDYYETDGIFCSFNCCLAYINDNSHNPMYKQSKVLLMNIYRNVCSRRKIKSCSLLEAPHWRTLTDFGGKLTISEFRNSFDKIEYKYHGKYIKSFPIGHLFEGNIRF